MKKINKGEIHNVLVLIIILVSAIVLFLILTSFNEGMTSEEAITTCRLSVIAQSSTSFGLITETSPLDINCDKRYVDIYNTRVERGLSLENMELVPVIYGSREVKKFNELNEDMVYQIIAEELRVCKYEFGDGRIGIFPNDKAGIFTGKNVCFACSEINFKQGVKKQDFLNLKDFVQTNKIPDKEYTYYDYLTEKTVFDDPMWEQITYDGSTPEKKIKLSSSESYLIVVNKNTYSVTKKLVYTSPLLRILPVRIKDGLYVTIVPSTEINTYCDIQAS